MILLLICDLLSLCILMDVGQHQVYAFCFFCSSHKMCFCDIDYLLIFLILFQIWVWFTIFILVEDDFMVVCRSWVLFLYCSNILEIFLVKSDVITNPLWAKSRASYVQCLVNSIVFCDLVGRLLSLKSITL